MTERITTPNADRTVQHHALPVDTTGLIFFAVFASSFVLYRRGSCFESYLFFSFPLSYFSNNRKKSRVQSDKQFFSVFKKNDPEQHLYYAALMQFLTQLVESPTLFCVCTQ